MTMSENLPSLAKRRRYGKEKNKYRFKILSRETVCPATTNLTCGPSSSAWVPEATPLRQNYCQSTGSIHAVMIHGILCGPIFTSNLVRGSQLLRICFQNDTPNWGQLWKSSLPLLMGPVETFKQTQCSYFIRGRSLLSSLSSTHSSWRRLWKWVLVFSQTDFRLPGFLVCHRCQNRKTVSSHLDPATFPSMCQKMSQFTICNGRSQLIPATFVNGDNKAVWHSAAAFDFPSVKWTSFRKGFLLRVRNERSWSIS